MAQKHKVMLIEDYHNCREILAALIRLMGYEVILANSDIAEETADIIVGYLDFPPTRTVRTIRALRADSRTKDIPIIVFLPWKYDDGALAALDAGANEVFDGPIKRDVLRAGIAKYIPKTFDPCEPTDASQPPATEAMNTYLGVGSSNLSGRAK